MIPTNTQATIKDNAGYVPASVHYHKRALDKKYEVVASLLSATVEKLGLGIGGAVVLDVQPNRTDALESVRYFRNK